MPSRPNHEPRSAAAAALAATAALAIALLPACGESGATQEPAGASDPRADATERDASDPGPQQPAVAPGDHQTPDDAPAGAADVDAQLVALGEHLFDRKGCLACHEIDPSVPYSQSTHMAGYYGSAVVLSDGRTVVADDAFIAESISDPMKAMRAGVTSQMPPVQLSPEEVMALVAYIASLGSLEAP